MGFALAPVYGLRMPRESRLELGGRGRMCQEQFESTRQLGCVFMPQTIKFSN